MSTFHESLTELCKSAAFAADHSDDRRDGYTEMLSSLSLTLGRTIGLASNGDALSATNLFRICIDSVGEEAAKTANILNLGGMPPEGSA